MELEANNSDFKFDEASWVFDTETTAHFRNNRNLFLTFEPVNNMQMLLAVGCKKPPFELYGRKRPSVSHLKRLGCLAFVGVLKQPRKKLDMRAKLGIMLGYALSTKGYRIWMIQKNKVVETISVRFDEGKRGLDSEKTFTGPVRNYLLKDFPEDGDIFSTVGAPQGAHLL
ncbi:retrovirus-related Pol polyprotein from transposon TNT 1-94 [Trichonephila clavipes]|nr:retrovirus-related Pol polyprotein from transposon TNT 1-94 [Trichonephila clavipes]